MTRVNRFIALTSIALLFGLITCGAAASAPSLCRDRMIIDYDKKVHRLQPGKAGFPEGEGLPFARWLELQSLDADQVVLNEEPVGFTIEPHREHHASGATAELQVRVGFSRAGTHGRQHVLVEALHHLEITKGRGFRFAQRPKPGIYRIDLEFQNGQGRRLALYKEFVRVLPRRVALRIAVDKSVVHAGETVFGRVENRGTVDALFPEGAALIAEHEANGTWVRVPVGQGDLFLEGAADFVRRGRASRCTSFKITSELPPGKYRFSALAEPFGRDIRARKLFSTFTLS
jgi:hypothetical protein